MTGSWWREIRTKNECFMGRVSVWEYENIWKWIVVMVAQKPMHSMPTQ